MRLIFFGLIFLTLAVLGTLYAIEDPGYVLIARSPWSIEMPLTLFVPLLLIGYLVLYVALFLIVRLWRIPRDVARWRVRRHGREGRTALTRGLTHLAEGNWVEAEAALLLSQRHGDAPLLSCLGAAVAAQGQGMPEKRDEYLAQAHRHAPEGGLAIGMVQAYLQHLAGQREQSLATLTNLHREQPRHKHVLKLLALVYGDLRDWTGLIELLPELRRTQALPQNELDELEIKAHRELLTQSLPKGALDVLTKAWGAVPKSLRRHPTLIAIHARQLLQQSDMKQAESVLRTALDTAWDPRLIALYGELRGEDVNEYLEIAEGWLAPHPDEAPLLLTLGRLAVHAGQLPKARQYLEQSFAREASTAAAHELGMLLERLGEKETALDVYRSGLESCLNGPRAVTRGRLDVRHAPAR